MYSCIVHVRVCTRARTHARTHTRARARAHTHVFARGLQCFPCHCHILHWAIHAKCRLNKDIWQIIYWFFQDICVKFWPAVTSLVHVARILTAHTSAVPAVWNIWIGISFRWSGDPSYRNGLMDFVQVMESFLLDENAFHQHHCLCNSFIAM